MSCESELELATTIKDTVAKPAQHWRQFSEYFRIKSLDTLGF